MLKRHEIQVLLKAGHSCSEVARLTGASLPSIYRIRKEGEVEHVDDARARRERGIGRRTQILQYEGQLRQWLEEDPNLLTVELFRRVRGAGYTGGKTAVYEFVATIRPKNVRPMVRFEGLAGEFSQHDFGQVEVRYDDGSTERVHFFASRLKYSRFAQVSLVPNEQVESLVRCLVDHYEGFGGVPLVSVFDRPKTVALR